MPRFEKGSQEAKDFMAKIRNIRKQPDYVPPANKKLTKKQKEKEELSKIKVDIPIMGETSLVVPEYFAVPRKNGYKLVNPMSQERNLSSRGGKKSLKIVRKPIGDMVLVKEDGAEEPLPLLAFTKKDRTLIQNYFKLVEQYKDKDPQDVPTLGKSKKVKERGRPTKLPKNIEVHKERNTKPNWSKKKKDDEEPENISLTMEEPPTGYQRKKRQTYASEAEKKEAIKKQKREFAQRKRDKLKAEKVEGGRIAAPEFKSLIDASYDPKQTQVGDYTLDKQISTSTSKVYHNPNTGQVVVAHKGTEGIMDWGNNAIYALGGKSAYKKTARYKEAKKVQNKAEKKYGAQNVSTIGHSQGGLQAELLGGKSKEIITLNKATRPFESNKNKNQFDVRSKGDIVSAANPFGKKSSKDIEIKSGSYNPLTEHSSGVLDKLDENLMIGKGAKESIVEKINKKRIERDDMMEAYHIASEELDTLYEKMMEGDDDSDMEGEGILDWITGTSGDPDRREKKSLILRPTQIGDTPEIRNQLDTNAVAIRRQVEDAYNEGKISEAERVGLVTTLNPPSGFFGGERTTAEIAKSHNDVVEGLIELLATKGKGLKSFKSGSYGSDYVIQSVLFDKGKYSVAEAKKWLKDNKYKSPKVDETDNMLRFRQLSPTDVDKKGYTDYRNKPLGTSGIQLVIAYRRKSEERMGMNFKKRLESRLKSMAGKGVSQSSAVAPSLFTIPQNETQQMRTLRIPAEKKYKEYLELQKPLTGLRAALADSAILTARQERKQRLYNEIMNLAEQYYILYEEIHPEEMTETESPPTSEGSGLKGKRKFAKGSQEAKDFMKSLRDKRKN